MWSMAKVRVQLDLSQAEAAALDTLRVDCGLRSRAEAVKVALGVLEWVRIEASRDRKVFGVGQGFVSTLVIPGVTSQQEAIQK